MFERNIRQRVVEHRAFALGHRVEPRGQVGELAEVETRDALVAVRQVVVRGAVVRVAHVEERIVERRQIAAQEQRGDARLVGLETPAR